MAMAPILALVLSAAAVAERGEAERGSLLGPGSPFPAVELRTVDGKPFASREVAGQLCVIVFVRHDQPDSLAALRDLKRLRSEIGGAWRAIAVASGRVSPEEARKAAAATGFTGTLLLDPDRAAYSSFGVVAVPSLAVFDAGSKVIYSRAGGGKEIFAAVAERLAKALGHPSPSPADPGAAPRPLRSAPKLEIARTLLERGELERAEATARAALEAEDTLEGNLVLVEVLLRVRPAQALEVLEGARRKHGASPRLDLAAARSLAALGKASEAEAALRELAVRAPGLWEAHLTLGELHEKTGRLDLAVKEYRKAIEILARRELGGVDRRP
ncbi:MAG: tetratricopeptide repeat protein [Planctomycetes bacterium]|nr:tetratricopeptide repeat protein [Planctomycetota bacterium]